MGYVEKQVCDGWVILEGVAEEGCSCVYAF